MKKLLSGIIGLLLYTSTAFADPDRLAQLICNTPTNMNELVAELTKPGFDINEDIELWLSKASPLGFATSELCFNLEAVKILLQYKADSNRFDYINLQVDTPVCRLTRLYFAKHPIPAQKYLEGIKALLDAGANPDCNLDLGITPLMVSAEKGNAELVNLFIHHHADVNRKDERLRNSLFYAVQKSMMEKLITFGADVNAQDSNGVTALMHSLEHTTDPYLPLLNAHADPNKSDHEGRTALMWLFMAKQASNSRVNNLLNAGADINAKMRDGTTALDCAFDYDAGAEGEGLKALLDRGAKFDCDNSPLLYSFYASMSYIEFKSRHLPKLEILLESKHNLNCVNHEGSFLTYAVQAVESCFSYNISYRCFINGRAQDDVDDYKRLKNLVLKAIAQGADKSFRDRNGKTAYDYAFRSTWGNQIKLLKP